MIEIRNLSKNFDKLKVFKNLNLEINKGEIVALIGSSGCGKTTLLNLIAGLDKDFDGEIIINGSSLNHYLTKKRIALVLQKYANFDWMTAIENIQTAFVNSIVKDKVRNDLVKSLIEKTGLNGFENSYISELSGGMQQRVAVARALAQKTEVLILDEPFNALDMENRTMLQKLFKTQIKDNKLTALIVTHDIEEAILLADSVKVLTSASLGIQYSFDTKDFNDRFFHNFFNMKNKIEQVFLEDKCEKY